MARDRFGWAQLPVLAAVLSLGGRKRVAPMILRHHREITVTKARGRVFRTVPGHPYTGVVFLHHRPYIRAGRELTYRIKMRGG